VLIGPLLFYCLLKFGPARFFCDFTFGFGLLARFFLSLFALVTLRHSRRHDVFQLNTERLGQIR
jgi:hypothetical protein